MSNNDFSPSPARLVESLRDTGYSLPMSIADIIDNSIAAGASKVRLDLFAEYDGELKLRLLDDGHGMDEQSLIDSMKYGSKKRVNPKSLGKFGMGLKTASTAFCRSLTVVSKKETISARQWDLDTIIETDEWQLLTPEVDDEDLSLFSEFIGAESGTMVVWEKIDRLIKSKSRVTAEKQLTKIVSDLKKHLSGVFGRFIDSNNYDEESVEIIVNGDVLTPWDPFCYWMEKGRVEREINNLKINIEGEEHDVAFNVHILPNKADMDEKEQLRARYKNEALENQGFHIYRENRLIFSGGWPNRMFAREPHMNLLRVELNFTHEIDEYFQIDIKKSGIVLPTDLFAELKDSLTPLRREANRRYRTGKASETSNKAKINDIHANSNKSIAKHSDSTVNSKIANQNPDNNTAEVENKFGKVTIKIPIEEKESDVSVETKDSLMDGVLWQYAIMNGKHGVHLNGAHEFYKRFYLNNIENVVLTQTMDFLFWSLAEAELSCVGDSAKRNFEEMRFAVSRILRQLAEELPEADNE
ncbi:MAG: ATP-binding protein [Flavobacteriales bacterium]|nr:ATP-binding protein [Flavobacteriales bacterium]|tara:strand:+ start:4790 stop:6370 length:1581 start_codon:yes stop_codon:yes gene_type:complete